MQTTIMPRTINRLFNTSMVLTGITLAYSSVARDAYDLYFSAAIFVWLLAVMANHFALYYLAKRPTARMTMSADGEARYPECLLSLPNIIFTFIAAMGLIGCMWAPIGSGIVDQMHPSRTYHSSGYRAPTFPSYTSILMGIFAYAESAILLTLFSFYVRQRRFHLKAVRECASSNTEDLKA